MYMYCMYVHVLYNACCVLYVTSFSEIKKTLLDLHFSHSKAFRLPGDEHVLGEASGKYSLMSVDLTFNVFVDIESSVLMMM